MKIGVEWGEANDESTLYTSSCNWKVVMMLSNIHNMSRINNDGGDDDDDDGDDDDDDDDDDSDDDDGDDDDGDDGDDDDDDDDDDGDDDDDDDNGDDDINISILWCFLPGLYQQSCEVLFEI